MSVSSAIGDEITQVSDRPMGDSAQKHLETYSGLDSRHVVYLSTPITTGPALLDWLIESRDRGEYTATAADIVRQEVIDDNVSRLGPLRAAIRSTHPEAFLIDPTDLNEPAWAQADYHRFWVEVINLFVDQIVFADGWHLSTGCAVEYATGLRLGIPMSDAAGSPLTPAVATQMLSEAGAALRAAGRDDSIALAAANRAAAAARNPLKDDGIANLAAEHNVASFVSTTPGRPLLRHRVMPGGCSRSVGLRAAVASLLASSSSGSVNVRTFRPDATKGNPFVYGLRDTDEALTHIESFAHDGFYCIVNETIDIHDGGVSGVSLGGIVEFAPDDTPRAVEGEDTARLPASLATDLLARVYGTRVKVPAPSSRRIEFSVHPVRVGQRREQIITWESEDVDEVAIQTEVTWPNAFSRLIGDKTYGLLVADILGFPVPRTTVVARRVAPFAFGSSTGTGEWWMRTAPARQTPGHFTTTRGWTDPFLVLAKEDVDGAVAAVLAQEGVDARFSGATMPSDTPQGHIVEGVRGTGDDFMLGAAPVGELPAAIQQGVLDLLASVESRLGAGIRLEWAADGDQVWVLQLHRSNTRGSVGVFSPGDASNWIQFDPSQGLEFLSDLIEEARAEKAGIEVTKPIGLTSHVGDLLRKASIPGRLSPQ